MGADALIEELVLKYNHLGLLIDFIKSDYSQITQGRLNRLEETCDSLIDIILELKDGR
jgi:hypothetical protein